jgi:hypothetical protein
MITDRPRQRVSFARREGWATATATWFSGGLLLAAFFAAGCSSLLGSNSSCSSTSPPQPPSATDAGATSEAAIEAAYLTELDHEIGQYLRGDVLAYRGAMKGTATVPIWYAYNFPDPPPNAAIAEGPALASLAFFPASPNDWPNTEPAAFANGNEAVLTVYSLAKEQSMVFAQPESDPTLTATGGIVDHSAENRLRATCSNCAPSFWARPAAIAFDLTAAGTITSETYYGSTVYYATNATASVQLAVVPSCSLTFDDLVTLNQNAGIGRYAVTGLSIFTLTGGEWVWDTSGSFPTNGPLPPGSCSGGVPYFNYTIELYVNASNLADYGVRNYVLEGTTVECPA